MKRVDAALQLRQCFAEHASTVHTTLRRFGVLDKEDRANLTQDVFLAGFRALLRGDVIENPRAWLFECARKYASNYRRKAQRQTPVDDRAIVSAVPTPEQVAEQRELLRRLFNAVDEEDQRIIFDVRVDGLPWSEVARKRGIKVSRAVYLYDRAVARMNKALERDDPRRKKRPLILLPLALERAFDAIRAMVDTVSPKLRRRIWGSLERRMDAAGVDATELDREHARGPRVSSISIPLDTPPAPPWRGRAMLGTFGGAIALVLGYLLLLELPGKSSPEPNLVPSIPVIAREEPAERAVDVQASAPLFPAIGSGTSLREPSARSPPVNRSTSASSPLKAASSPDSLMLLDRARSALRAGSARAALALLAQHASRFPDGPNAKFHQKLLQRVCAAPSARGASECASQPLAARAPGR
ncbi:MAG: RNA polymerase sigma factor [Byssovorax sp.]